MPANRPAHDAGPAQMGDRCRRQRLHIETETETRDFQLERPGESTLLSGPAAGKGLEVTGTERREELRFSSWPAMGLES